MTTSDTDEKLESEIWVEEPDSVEVEWSYTGGSVTLFPLVGNSTTAYFDLCPIDENVTILAYAPNVPGSPAADPPVQKQKQIRKKVPTGINVIGVSEPNLAPFELNATGSVIGVATAFYMQVVSLRVDFSNVPFRENIEAQSFTFPSGTVVEYPAKVLGFMPRLQVSVVNGLNVVQPNVFFDNLAEFRAKEYLLKDGAYTNMTVDLKVPYEFDAGSGDWTKIIESTHKREYVGASLKCRMTMIVSDSLSGIPRGPWKPKQQ